MKFIRFSVFLATLSLASLGAQPLKLSVKAKAAILYNPRNGAILFEKNAQEPHYPASITKIATALYVLDAKKLDLESRFVASSHALKVMNAEIKQASPMDYPSYVLEHDGVRQGIQEGDCLSLNTLLHSLMLYSSNDAANVIAEGCSGSVDAFMEELNAYLRKKGIMQTRFQNPHGLHHPAQLTTAYDIAKFTGLAFENSTFMKIDQAREYKWEGHPTIINSNRLLKEGKYRYPRALGGKTGYTASSGYNLVVAAEENGRRLIAVVLGCEQSEDRFKDAIALFENAFREKPVQRTLFSKGDNRFHREVPKSTTLLRATLKNDLIFSYYPSEEGKLAARILWQKLRLPVKKGACVGEVVVEDERGNQVAHAPLFSAVHLKAKRSFWPLSILTLPVGVLLWVLFKAKKKRSKFLQ